MTDSEKELRRLAQECEDRRCGGYWPANLRALHGALWPKDVLALLDRIEALENMQAKAELSAALGPALDIIREPLLEMGCTFPGGGLVGIAEGIREVVAKAERKGAEEMRAEAAKRLEWRGTECWLGDSTTAITMRRVYEEEANEIRRLLLPGDTP